MAVVIIFLAWNFIGKKPVEKIAYSETVVSTSTPQFVILSFDGSKSVDMLNETLDFERKMKAQGEAVHFTYFINPVYFLPSSRSYVYQAPRQKPGVSTIGFSDSSADVALRVAAFNEAMREGNEIGSHAVGHFNGSDWSHDEWKQEFDSFDTLVADIQQNNLPVVIETSLFNRENIVGFRAPDLGVNEQTYKILSEFHFSYDSSGIDVSDTWPKKDSYGVWHIPLGMMTIGPQEFRVTTMDYNVWMHQSNAHNVLTKNSLEWNSHLREVVDAYVQYFNRHYEGSRAPVVIGGHFSQWNDGLYWEAMKIFAQNVCGKTDVRCSTYSELVAFMNASSTLSNIEKK